MTAPSPLPVSVLIVTWNSGSVLAACLDSLRLARPAPAEVVVIDNASEDDSVAVAREHTVANEMPVHILPSPENRGFAGGMNMAIAESTEPLVFLMNPDLRLLPETLEVLTARMEESDDDVYAIGPKLLRASGADLVPTDTLDSAGIQMTRDGRHFDIGADQTDVGQFDEPQEVFGLSGAAVLLKRQALADSRVDGEVFDEDFFAYREDADLAWRMRGFGYRALVEPRAVAYHQRRVTPSRRQQLPSAINYHSVKNRFLLRIHHADARWWIHGGWRSIVRDLIVVGACLTVERTSLPALVWLSRHWRRHLRRRRAILRRRVVPSASLESWFT